MYLKRKADDYLEEWHSNLDRKPLIVKGARQVGKTNTIRRFASEHYENVVEINFFTHPIYKGIVESGYATSDIVKIITRINPEFRFVPGNTLIFFDEIQNFPEIATSFKFFKEDGRFDVISSGSLLGVNYNRIDSISVGYKSDYDMYSMDFEEFLWAKGYGEDVVSDILEHMINGKKFLDVEHNLYSDLFVEYCMLGGMPEVVASFIGKNSFEGSLAIQKQLLKDYESDIRKYSEGLDQARILSVFRSIPAQLAKENKKFQYSKVRKGGRSKDYSGCIEWIKDAGMVNVCNCLNYPELPLKGNEDISKFKVYMADTGLLIASVDDEAQNDLRGNKNLGIYKGALYENFAAESLAKQGYNLYYYKRDNSTLEEDFFVRSADNLIPIEIKAGKSQSKSMKELINNSDYPDIEFGIKITSGNVGIAETIITFPHYCMFLLKRYISEKYSG